MTQTIDVNRLEAVLFDFDGVVVQSEAVYDRATSKLGALYNATVPEDFFEANRGIAEALFYERFKRDLNLDVDLEDLSGNGQRLLWEEFASSVEYTPGFHSFYTRVRATVPHVGLVTATPRPLIERIFGNSQIDVKFDQMITASDVVRTKPDPEPYAKMCQLLGVSAKHALVIEDSPTGLRSATLAGCQTVAITTSCTRDSLKEANFVVDSFGELEELLTTV